MSESSDVLAEMEEKDAPRRPLQPEPIRGREGGRLHLRDKPRPRLRGRVERLFEAIHRGLKAGGEKECTEKGNEFH